MKKGFTLVELLAVIVIMTIIILIAVPNVISSVNSAKKENFGNEVTTVVSTAKTQFNLDKGRGTVRYDYIDNERVAVYCLNWHVEGEEDCNSKNKIAATNEEGTSYKIELDVSGNVKSTYMTDGRFYYSCCGEECTEYDVETIVDSAKSNDIPLTCDGKVFNNTSGNANNGENNNSSSQTHAHVKINTCRIDAMVAKDIEYYCYADQTVDECYGGRMATQVLYYSQKSTDDNSAFESCSATLANNKSNSFNDIVNCYNKAKTFDYCVSRAEDMYLDCESSGQNRFCTYKSGFYDAYDSAMYACTHKSGFYQTVSGNDYVVPMSEGCYASKVHVMVCLDGDSEVEVYDKKKKKKIKKKLKDVTYDDLILCWDFVTGTYTYAKPLWIMKPEEVSSYIVLKFSDGSEIKVMGDHRVFNADANKFTSCKNEKESPIGMTTINAKGERITLVSRKEVNEPNVAYNVITDKCINLYANGILTSRGLNNLYPIEDMKFVKEEREVFTREELKEIPDEYFYGLNLGETPRTFMGSEEKTKDQLLLFVERTINTKK